MCSRDTTLVQLEKGLKNVNIDDDDDDDDDEPCASSACDFYTYLREFEEKKRPSADFMERIQTDINSIMRAILIDWLVEVAEHDRLVPDTLYLTVNYIDRYLSENVISSQKLQLLGVACMMIASKHHEEICPRHVEAFCYITENTYTKEEVLEMESSVMKVLKFETAAPTIQCFLRRFLRATNQEVHEVESSLQLECLSNYIAELSLMEYKMLCYAPSLIAASSIFLARVVLFPSKEPWNPILQNYTLYQPSDLIHCIKDLNRLCCNNHNSNSSAIKKKYSQDKYKHVAEMYSPLSILQNLSMHRNTKPILE